MGTASSSDPPLVTANVEDLLRFFDEKPRLGGEARNPCGRHSRE